MAGRADARGVYVDYLMSQKFGLDWRHDEYGRMYEFTRIMEWEAERERHESEKNKPREKRFR